MAGPVRGPRVAAACRRRTRSPRKRRPRDGCPPSRPTRPGASGSIPTAARCSSERTPRRGFGDVCGWRRGRGRSTRRSFGSTSCRAIDAEVPALGRSPLGDLTPELVRAWYAALSSQQRGPSVAAKAYTRLRQILTRAVDDERIAKNPCRIAGGGVERHPEQRFASMPELYELAAAVPDRYRALVLTAGLAGLRQGELFAPALGRRRSAGRHDHRQAQAPAPGIGRGDRGRPQERRGQAEGGFAGAARRRAREHLRRFGERRRRRLRLHVHRRASRWSGATSASGSGCRRPHAVGLEGLRFHDLRHTAGTLDGSDGGHHEGDHGPARPCQRPRGDGLPARDRGPGPPDRRAAHRHDREAGLATVTSLRPDGNGHGRAQADLRARIWHDGQLDGPGDRRTLLTCSFAVVGTGVDPVTSRFSGARSAN